MKKDGFIDRKILGDIVFNAPDQLQILNNIMTQPIMVRLRKEISGKEGIILINCALLVEGNMLPICNNNVILIEVDKDVQYKRLKERNLTDEQISTRLSCQYTTIGKQHHIEKIIKKQHHGILWTIDNSYATEKEILKQFDIIKEELCLVSAY